VRLVLVRHLPTAWNREGLLQGCNDQAILPPDEGSLKEIATNKLLLGQYQLFELVLASGLKRTQETAVLYGRNSFVVEPLLNELDFGLFEGRPRAEMEIALSPLWLEDPRDLVLGISLATFEKRITAFIDKYRQCQQLLAFGHGAWIRGMVSLVRHGDLRGMNRFVLPHNALVEVTLEGEQASCRVVPPVS